MPGECFLFCCFLGLLSFRVVVGIKCVECNVRRAYTPEISCNDTNSISKDNYQLDHCSACMKTKTVLTMYGNAMKYDEEAIKSLKPIEITRVSKLCVKQGEIPATLRLRMPDEDMCAETVTAGGYNIQCWCFTSMCNSSAYSLKANIFGFLWFFLNLF